MLAGFTLEADAVVPLTPTCRALGDVGESIAWRPRRYRSRCRHRTRSHGCRRDALRSASRESKARSRNDRPDTTATWVWGSPAIKRKGRRDSSRGCAAAMSSTRGASVPSKSVPTSNTDSWASTGDDCRAARVARSPLFRATLFVPQSAVVPFRLASASRRGKQARRESRTGWVADQCPAI